MEEENELYIGFIRLIGQEIDGYYSYELVFTEHPDSFWGENFEYKPSGLVNELIPDEKYVDKLVKLKTQVKLDLAQESLCFGFQDVTDGILALAWENIDEYDEYPDYRLVIKFGETYDELETKLAKKNILID